MAEPTYDMGYLSALMRLVRVLDRFRDMEPGQTLAAIATADGGAEHLTYGDLGVLVRELGAAGERLSRISDWHSRESGPAGTFGDYCTECGHTWPCDTRRMADGAYVDDDEPEVPDAEST